MKIIYKNTTYIISIKRKNNKKIAQCISKNGKILNVKNILKGDVK